MNPGEKRQAARKVWSGTVGFAWLLSRSTALHGAILFFLNVLFVVKYGTRVSLHPALSISLYLVYFLAQLTIMAFVSLWVLRRERPGVWLWIAVGLYVLAGLLVYLPMDPNKIQVDRWSALHNFLEALGSGQYPWQVETHLGSRISGFPGLFVLALPFYLVGDVGYLQFGALIAFVVLMVIRFRDGARPLYLFAALAAMPAFMYQVLCRSDLFGNMVVVAWLLHFATKPDAGRGGRLLLWAAVWGLVASTRAIVVIPLILGAARLLHDRTLRDVIVFGVISLAVFAGTFLPFYLWDSGLFWAYNPYHVQAGYASREVLALVLLSTCAIAYRYRAARDGAGVFLHAGLLLFFTILLCWVLKSLEKGWVETLWQHQFDVTYFTLGVPFLLLSWGDGLPSLARQKNDVVGRKS